MASPNPQTLAKTAALFTALRERAAQRPAHLKREWFNQSLFKTRSDEVAAYLNEAERNALKLAEIPPSSPVYNYFSEVVEAQLQALVQALYRA